MSEFYLWADDTRNGVITNLGKFVRSLPVDKQYTVKVEPYKKPRTDPQNNALWGVAYATIEAETGNEADDLHIFFCGEFFGWKTVMVMGEKRRKPVRSTTHDENGKRDVIPWDRFCKFYELIQRRAAEGGVFVPDPVRNAA